MRSMQRRRCRLCKQGDVHPVLADIILDFYLIINTIILILSYFCFGPWEVRGGGGCKKGEALRLVSGGTRTHKSHAMR